ncbi:MAG: FixH family protein [Alphaproteobacteria bacterium]|jgi:nitrogen fixation protein FixH|nr:FixH family protein [Alphaproteobacteria bacterium]
MTGSTAKELTGRHVLAMLVGFFAVILVANIVFVWLALDSWTGLDTENAYLRGLDYNRTLEQAAAQQRLGWRLDYEIVDEGANRRLTVRLSDRDGAPIAGLRVGAQLKRPTHDGHDLALTLEPRGGGVYGATFRPPLPGQWDLTVRAGRGEVPDFVLEDRIEIR